MIRITGYGVIAEKPRVGKLGQIFPCTVWEKRWIEKWMTPFRMGTTSSITMQSLGEIVQRAPAVGAKMWCLFFFTGRMSRSGKLPVLFLLTGQNQVFRPAGATRCTDSGQTLQDRRAPVSAWPCKISRQSVHTGGNAAPKISNISTFW